MTGRANYDRLSHRIRSRGRCADGAAHTAAPSPGLRVDLRAGGADRRVRRADRQARHAPPRPDPVPRRLANRRQARRGDADPVVLRHPGSTADNKRQNLSLAGILVERWRVYY